MWANVLARQPVASGRVQDGNNPNLMLEPKTGSIYMKKKANQRGREGQTEALSKIFEFHPHRGIGLGNVDNGILDD